MKFQLPECRHRGRQVRPGRFQCKSNRLVHRDGTCTADFCARCPYADAANRTAPEDCPHRGDVVRSVQCTTCGRRGESADVFACALYAECTLERVHKRIRPCAFCVAAGENLSEID